LKVGDKVKGKVVVMADYGAFVEIAPGVEGLIHVSEMSWSQHLRSAQDFLKVGEEVEAQILTLDREERKMSLGIKQLKKDPWEEIETKYAIGSKHSAKVRNFTNFGIFVEIEEGVEGLIHISDLSWTKKIKHPSEFTSIGSDIDVIATIALPYGVEGFAPTRHLTKEDGTIAKNDEKLKFKVIEFSKSAKRIILSHSRTFSEEKKVEESSTKKSETTQSNQTNQANKANQSKKSMKSAKNNNIEKTTLGDISELAALKSQMEKEENKKEVKAKNVKKAAPKKEEANETKNAESKKEE